MAEEAMFRWGSRTLYEKNRKATNEWAAEERRMSELHMLEELFSDESG